MNYEEEEYELEICDHCGEVYDTKDSDAFFFPEDYCSIECEENED